MDWRNRLGIYGCYLCGTAGIGFTLPFLPLYLSQEGLADRAIGVISTCAALSGLLQFPIGLWSDRIGFRKPFLLAALGFLAISAALLQGAHEVVWVGILVVLFAENGICRAIIESLTGAEVTALAAPDEVGAALGRLRTWKPIGIIIVALVGSWWATDYGIEGILILLTVIQVVGFFAAMLIHEPRGIALNSELKSDVTPKPAGPPFLGFADRSLWIFIVAMVLFHAANAPGGLYLGLFMKRELKVPDSWLAYSFVVSMLGWTLTVSPVGKIADRIGRRPLLILTWALMSLRLFIVSIATSPAQLIANQFLDGMANGLFAVLAATWVTDRMKDTRRSGEAQVIVGTSLVLGSAIGPAISSFIVSEIGYRALFGCLGAVGACATILVALFIPESLPQRRIAAAILPHLRTSDG